MARIKRKRKRNPATDRWDVKLKQMKKNFHVLACARPWRLEANERLFFQRQGKCSAFSSTQTHTRNQAHEKKSIRFGYDTQITRMQQTLSFQPDRAFIGRRKRWKKKGRKTIRERQSERVRQIERTRDDGNDGGKKIAREMERNGQRERESERATGRGYRNFPFDFFFGLNSTFVQ